MIISLAMMLAEQISPPSIATEQSTEIRWDIKNATNDGCGFVGGKIDFCDKDYLAKIHEAYRGRTPNFNKKFLVVPVVIPFYRDTSISYVVIDTQSAVARPLPFDFLEAISEPADETTGLRHAKFSVEDSKICLVGAIGHINPDWRVSIAGVWKAEHFLEIRHRMPTRDHLTNSHGRMRLKRA